MVELLSINPGLGVADKMWMNTDPETKLTPSIPKRLLCHVELPCPKRQHVVITESPKSSQGDSYRSLLKRFLTSMRADAVNGQGGSENVALTALIERLEVYSSGQANEAPTDLAEVVTQALDMAMSDEARLVLQLVKDKLCSWESKPAAAADNEGGACSGDSVVPAEVKGLHVEALSPGGTDANAGEDQRHDCHRLYGGQGPGCFACPGPVSFGRETQPGARAVPMMSSLPLSNNKCYGLTTGYMAGPLTARRTDAVDLPCALGQPSNVSSVPVRVGAASGCQLSTPLGSGVAPQAVASQVAYGAGVGPAVANRYWSSGHLPSAEVVSWGQSPQLCSPSIQSATALTTTPSPCTPPLRSAAIAAGIVLNGPTAYLPVVSRSVQPAMVVGQGLVSNFGSSGQLVGCASQNYNPMSVNMGGYTLNPQPKNVPLGMSTMRPYVNSTNVLPPAGLTWGGSGVAAVMPASVAHCTNGAGTGTAANFGPVSGGTVGQVLKYSMQPAMTNGQVATGCYWGLRPYSPGAEGSMRVPVTIPASACTQAPYVHSACVPPPGQNILRMAGQRGDVQCYPPGPLVGGWGEQREKLVSKVGGVLCNAKPLDNVPQFDPVRVTSAAAAVASPCHPDVAAGTCTTTTKTTVAPSTSASPSNNVAGRDVKGNESQGGCTAMSSCSSSSLSESLSTSEISDEEDSEVASEDEACSQGSVSHSLGSTTEVCGTNKEGALAKESTRSMLGVGGEMPVGGTHEEGFSAGSHDDEAAVVGDLLNCCEPDVMMLKAEHLKEIIAVKMSTCQSLEQLRQQLLDIAAKESAELARLQEQLRSLEAIKPRSAECPLGVVPPTP